MVKMVVVEVERHLPYGITRHRWTHPTLTPARQMDSPTRRRGIGVDFGVGYILR